MDKLQVQKSVYITLKFLKQNNAYTQFISNLTTLNKSFIEFIKLNKLKYNNTNIDKIYIDFVFYNCKDSNIEYVNFNIMYSSKFSFEWCKSKESVFYWHILSYSLKKYLKQYGTI